MNEDEALQHVEMFVRNKVREGYKGLTPKRNARNNVMRVWAEVKDKGEMLTAANVLGGVYRTEGLVELMTNRIFNFKSELKMVLGGEYPGSQEDMINEIWKD